LGITAGTDIFNAFKTGYLPMFISGPWMLEEIHKQVPEIDDKWSVSILPKKAYSTSFVGGSNLVIFKQSKNQDIAWRFIEFVSQPHIQVEWYKETKDLPSVKLAWEDPSLKGNSRLDIFGQQLKDAKAPPSIPEWEQIGDTINNHMEQVVFQKIDIDTFIRGCSADINAILNTKLEKQNNFFKAGHLSPPRSCKLTLA
jgi:multiple sugar transport system substrate-binding protein